MDNQKIINLSKTLFEITNQGTDILSTYSLAEKLVAAGYGYVDEYKQQIKKLEAEVSGANILIKVLQNQIKAIQEFINTELNNRMSKEETALGLQKAMNVKD